MAKFDKFQVMAKIAEAPMVPVFYNKDVEVCKNVIKACYEGGVRAFEFTNRGDFAHEVFGELSKWVNKECPELALGIGSVVDAPTTFSLHPVRCQLRGWSSVQPRYRCCLQPSLRNLLPRLSDTL